MHEPVRVGVVGCGAISGHYLKYAGLFPILEVVACADLERSRAEARAAEYGVPRVLEVEELLADDEVEVVLNLTVPKAHAPLCRQALESGKHAFAEKPLGINREEGQALAAAARRTGLRVGCAPDTFLGAGLQTARQAIDGGAIGRPVAFTAYTMGCGHERWHPNPEFFFQVGGGPMLDMGPYYVTALLNLLGPVRRLSASAAIAMPERTIASEPKKGQVIHVETPDHLCGTLEFTGGAVGTLVASFAIINADYNPATPVTVYGTEGAIRVGDPNSFDRPSQLRRAGEDEWRELPHTFVEGYGRAVGLADMATAIRTGRPHRCSLEQAYCALDIMQGYLDSAASGRHYDVQAPYQRPAPMPADLPLGYLDD